ncbi:MAG: membrane protein insertion efficiency factor YidD [Saprospiraceae bacterium]|nr:membrane protein insertion efficiency factor YidD [Saprospiraceae bacterium]
MNAKSHRIVKILSQIAILPVRVYQKFLSPLLPPSCRYQPTCSQYMIDAINEWGPLKGIWLGLKRIARCHPWGGHGHDPVPSKKEKMT